MQTLVPIILELWNTSMIHLSPSTSDGGSNYWYGSRRRGLEVELQRPSVCNYDGNIPTVPKRMIAFTTKVILLDVSNGSDLLSRDEITHTEVRF